MARPRTFDEAGALDAAMRVFWANGYEATSTHDLCVATGLGRSSIYNTFQSKHELYRRALAHYIDTMTTRQLTLLDDAERSPLERLRALFADVVQQEVEVRRGGRSLGCLVVNATVEQSGRDPEAAGMLERDLARRLAALRTVLAAGQRSGEVTSQQDPEALARFVTAVIGGIRVSGQGGAEPASLESIAQTALAALVA
ncbi:TetR/AcrR family transcriptional regulator [Streptomyces oceani]|uniref:Transcriptional regulator n=1 Tax=Streptomyces oceani TaxID=1075402 RepID=A0A1E7KK34_9ACTN|nr:TetR/AcrR family transcriptional regulator [Streptomyces oceani]OEV04207.1 transcriptional regulator [Streptomyces oceani]